MAQPFQRVNANQSNPSANFSFSREMNQQQSHDEEGTRTYLNGDYHRRGSEQLASLWTAICSSTPGLIHPVVAGIRAYDTAQLRGLGAPLFGVSARDRVGDRFQAEPASTSVLEGERTRFESQKDDTCVLDDTKLASKQDPGQQTATPLVTIGADNIRSNDHVHSTHHHITPLEPTPVPFFNAGSEIVPQKYDVLFGRGKKHRDFPGNVRMQLLADIHREKYTISHRDEKTDITRGIVDIIKSSGINSGRFLKFQIDRDCWLEVSDEVARKKVGHALRDGRGRPIQRIDPKVLKEILPLLSDPFKQAALQMGRSNLYQNLGEKDTGRLIEIFAKTKQPPIQPQPDGKE